MLQLLATTGLGLGCPLSERHRLCELARSLRISSVKTQDEGKEIAIHSGSPGVREGAP